MTNAARPLRVAIMIGSDGPGGAEMVVFRLASELRRRGHVPVPVGLENGVGWLGKLLRDAGMTWDTVPLGKSWFDTQCVRRLMRLYREQKIDVVHSHEFDMAFYGAISARLAGVPNIVTMHGGLTATKALQRRVALRIAMGLSRASIAVSHATQHDFATDLGVRESAFGVIHNGVPVTAGSAEGVRKEFGVGENEIVLLAVGNLEHNKGHHVLLDAMRQIDARHPGLPWRVIIAGGRGGPEEQNLRSYVAQHGLEQRVHIVLGRNDVADLQALASVFVMPSYWEGLPMALLEGMIAGNAIAASATGGIPEAIVDQRDGLLVPPGDALALSNAIESLLVDANRREQFGAAARARGLAEFTVVVMTDRYESLYADRER